MTDEQIVEKVRENKEFFGELVDRYEKKLMRYADYLVYNDDDASDVVQNALIKVFVNLNSFNTKMKFSSWVYRITHNEAMSFIRKKSKAVRLDTEVDWASGEDLEDDLIQKELKERAHGCLEEMPEKYRVALVLFYLEEKSYEEISDILRLPMGTVATNISRAKKIMKSICKKK